MLVDALHVDRADCTAVVAAIPAST